MVIGALSGAVGMVLQLMFMSTEPRFVPALLIPGLFIGVAAGASFPGSVGAIMTDIEPRFFSMAGAARQTLFQLTLALTIAVAFTIIGRPERPGDFLDVMTTTWVMVLCLFLLQAVLFFWFFPRKVST